MARPYLNFKLNGIAAKQFKIDCWFRVFEHPVIILQDLIDNLQSKQLISRCPDCLSPSKKLHSCYLRKFRDLPMFGKSCNRYLQFRKFRCLKTECKRKIFTERFDDHFEPCKRRTKRLDEKLLTAALEMGGRPAERICSTLSMPVVLYFAKTDPQSASATGKLLSLSVC